MAVYLSGPITGIYDYKERFERAQLCLLNITHEPILNPLYLGQALENPKWIDYMELDLNLIVSKCNAIFFMDGWEKSDGCRLEMAVAKGKGIPIFFLKGF